jgi:carbonic anhydrase
MCELCDQPSRRGVFAGIAAGAGLALATRGLAAPADPPPKPANVISPDAALDRLMAGNARFVAGQGDRHNLVHERALTAKGQNPFAAILGCADSRVSPELAFDTGLGDLFVCRVAGNFANDDMIASLEYAVAKLNVPLVMVLGHGSCGAVAATIESLKTGQPPPGRLPSLVAEIAPAVKAAQGQEGDLLAHAIRENVILNVKRLQTTGPILGPAVDAGKLRVVGGVYDLASGRVERIV